jgi:hypothetical protein
MVKRVRGIINTYDLLLVTIIKSQVCYEDRIPLDTKCLSPPARSELLAVRGFPSASAVRVPTYTCNDTCIALSGRVQRHLYFDLLGRSAWSLLASVAGIAGHQYDAVF